MQRLEIIGHIGKDAEVKDFNTNQVINFPVAVSESYTDKNGEKVTNTTWYEVSKWGNSTKIAEYLKKGTQVFISGKPGARAWKKEDGSIVTVLCLNASDIKLLGFKQEAKNTDKIPFNTGNQIEDDDPNNDLPF